MGNTDRFNQALERRASALAGSHKYPSGAKLVKSAQFRQVLTKHVRRQARFGRTFCLASLQILEYEHIAKNMGEQAADKLHQLGCDVFLQSIRASDKLCLASPGKFLLLLSDTDRQSASKTLARLTQLTAQAKIHYHRKALRASCLARLVDSAEGGGDLEVLLASVGFGLDDEREFCWVGTQSSTAVAGHVTVGGEFTSWVERYSGVTWVAKKTLGRHLQLTEMTALDSWNNNGVVRIRALEPADEESCWDDDVLQIILARAKVLQSIDHPAIIRLQDYSLKECRALYLVQDNPVGQKLSDYLSIVDVDVALVLDWGQQILNSIIYLQGVVPPVVLSQCDENMFIVVPHKHLMLTDYEIPYLFPRWYKVMHVSSEDIEAIAQGRPTAAYVPVIRSFARFMILLLARIARPPESLVTLLARLDAESLPLELNTAFKVRASLKAVSDITRVDLTARR
ncbi:MAG: diguanylate cyclase [Candidatus Melainabacteria bacterium]|nr:diguanylate cyclase [Candidatus Melainabacteria bacterium]